MSRPLIHIVADFVTPGGGCDHATTLRELVSAEADVCCWIDAPHPGHLPAGIRQISAYSGSFPRGGTLVILGPHRTLAPWASHSGANRIILICNASDPTRLFAQLAYLRSTGLPEPEISFVSERLRDTMNIGGEVNISPIMAECFAQDSSPRRPTIGRHCRDTPLKHHPDDPSLYRQFALMGTDVRILGGTCLANAFGSRIPDGIQLLPFGELPPRDFLAGIDIYFHRPHPEFSDAAPRAVLEAMAAGCAVVVSPRTGATDWIRHGENGFLADSQDEAHQIISELIHNPALRRATGSAARDLALRISGPEARQRIARWLLAQPGITPTSSV